MTGPHRWQAGFGGTCTACGKQQHIAEHFGGDSVAATEAYLLAKRRNDDRERFRAGLQTGVRVRVTGDHPRDELAERDGVVVSVTPASNTAEVLFEADGELRRTQLHLPIRYLDSPPLPRPPKFSSIEEAEAWMEQSAPDMGVPYPDLPPRFESVEEADEWLRRKAGEPYVPPSWEPDPDQAALDAYDELYSGGSIKGATPTHVIYDEVYEMGRADPVMRIVRDAIAHADGTKPWEAKP